MSSSAAGGGQNSRTMPVVRNYDQQFIQIFGDGTAFAASSPQRSRRDDADGRIADRRARQSSHKTSDSAIASLLQLLDHREKNWMSTRATLEERQFLDRHACPITHELMMDPITVLGRTYERTALREWIARNTTCPSSRRFLQVTVHDIDAMDTTYLVRDDIVHVLRGILDRMPPPRLTPVQQLLVQLRVDPSQRVPFQRFLRQQQMEIQASTRQELKKAWIRYSRIKKLSSVQKNQKSS